MRISGNNNLETISTSKLAQTNSALEDTGVKQGSNSTDTSPNFPVDKLQLVQSVDNSEETKAKVKQVVETMNEMLEVNNNASKFMFHEGLERYYVTVVDKATEEVVKEIPPKKLLDAFYEMQKMLGMVVDEKI